MDTAMVSDFNSMVSSFKTEIDEAADDHRFIAFDVETFARWDMEVSITTYDGGSSTIICLPLHDAESYDKVYTRLMAIREQLTHALDEMTNQYMIFKIDEGNDAIAEEFHANEEKEAKSYKA
jgi:hypothetical protein